MSDDNEKSSAKPAWERPVVVDLAETGQGRGVPNCVDGSSPLGMCLAGAIDA